MLNLNTDQFSLKLRRGQWLSMILLLLLSATVSILSFSLARTPTPALPASAFDISQLPLAFEANKGQIDPNAKFQVRDMGGTIYFTPNEIVLSLPATDQDASVVRMSFVGANQSPTINGVDQLPGVVNYLIGNDPSAWHANIPTYASVVYEQLYPGIDLYYDGLSQRLKGTYIVATGADPSLIRWRHTGASGVAVDSATGNLIVSLGAGNTPLTEEAPIAWQEINGARTYVPVSFSLAENGDVGFALGRYNTAFPLTIDPTLSYGTYLGGSKQEDVEHLAVDSAGNVFVTGSTASSNFPLKNPIQANRGDTDDDDVFISKINAAGNALIYSTYLGGDKGENSFGVAVDSNGNAYVVGSTGSSDFPTANAYQSMCSLVSGFICLGDAFIAKLNPAGSSLIYSTYLGGEGIDSAIDVAVDNNGNAYVTGNTTSTDFPTKSPYQAQLADDFDVFVTKINAAGSSLVYSTYLGGTAADFSGGIALDGSNNAYIVGLTTSGNFPTKNPYQGSQGGSGDAFVTKFNASGGGLVYSTYLGGSKEDQGKGIVVDNSGNAYISGKTKSTNFPIQNAFQASLNGSDDDAFVAKLSANGGSLGFSTYLGGSDFDEGKDIAIDSSGNVYVTGTTLSNNFPTANPLPNTSAKNGDVFVTKFNSGGSSLAYSTYFGGSSSDQGDSIVVDNAGNAYVAGGTDSNDMPTVNPLQSNNKGNGDGFIIKISDGGNTNPTPDTPTPDTPTPDTPTPDTPTPNTPTPTDTPIPDDTPTPITPTVPTPSPDDVLSASFKFASDLDVESGESLTYKIRLINSGFSAMMVNVSDQLPVEMTFDGGITGGGSYDSGSRTVTWSNVEVPGFDYVTLSFDVIAGSVNQAKVVTNEAVISPVGGDPFERRFAVLVYDSDIGNTSQHLAGSYKYASKLKLSSNEELTYKIRLHNSGPTDAVVDVFDNVPDTLQYVSGGSYDAGTDTVSWKDVDVPSFNDVVLTFKAKAGNVDKTELVINEAVINPDDDVPLERQFAVLLTPNHDGSDKVSPEVNSLTISDKDVLTDRNVTINVSASDDVAVTEMYLREWQLVNSPAPHWEVVQSTGWIPYQANISWQLGSASGAHIVGVWVADDAGNRSYIDRNAIDVASLLLPGETVATHDLVPYLVSYKAGENVSATLNTLSGDADLYVWYPGNIFWADHKSVNEGTATDAVNFTTPEEGLYLFVVYADEAATFDFSISPEGEAVAARSAQSVNQKTEPMPYTATSQNNKEELANERVLISSGLDPLATAPDPGAPLKPQLYIPLIINAK